MDFSKKQDLAIALSIAVLWIVVAAWAAGFVQAFWWDEADYAVNARDILHYGSWGVSGTGEERGPLVSVLFAFTEFFLGDGLAARVLPAVFGGLALAAVYLLARRFYAPPSALAAVVLLAASPLFLFYSTRVLPEIILIALTAITILFAWRGFVESNYKHAAIAVFAATLGFLTNFRFVAVIAGIAIGLAVVLLLNRAKWPFSVQKTGLLAAIAVLTLIPLFVVGFNLHGNPLYAPLAQYSGNAPAREPWDFYLQILPQVFNPWGLVLALGGIVVAFWKRDQPSILLAITFIVAFAAMNTIGVKVDRYILPVLIPGVILGGRALAGSAKKVLELARNRAALSAEHGVTRVAITVIAFLVLAFGFVQVVTAGPPAGWQLLQAKADSFNEVKEAGFYLLANTLPGETVMTDSRPQTIFYSQRKIVDIPLDTQEFLRKLDNGKIRFVEVSLYEDKQAQLIEALNSAQALASGQRQPQNSIEFMAAHPEQFKVAKIFERTLRQGKAPMVILFQRITTSALAPTNTPAS